MTHYPGGPAATVSPVLHVLRAVAALERARAAAEALQLEPYPVLATVAAVPQPSALRSADPLPDRLFEFDVDGNGTVDVKVTLRDRDRARTSYDRVTIEFDVDGDGQFEIRQTAVDRNDDGDFELIVSDIDRNRDGLIDKRVTTEDTDGDGFLDTRTTETDLDGDGRFDSIQRVKQNQASDDVPTEIVMIEERTDSGGRRVVTTDTVQDSDRDGRFDRVTTEVDANGDGAIDTRHRVTFGGADAGGYFSSAAIDVDVHLDGGYALRHAWPADPGAAGVALRAGEGGGGKGN
jgi:hypothetical protein